MKILPQKYPNIGVAAFVDFFDVKGAIEAKESKLKWNGHELRANFKFDKSEGVKSHDRERHERYWEMCLCLLVVCFVRSFGEALALVWAVLQA